MNPASVDEHGKTVLDAVEGLKVVVGLIRERYMSDDTTAMEEAYLTNACNFILLGAECLQDYVNEYTLVNYGDTMKPPAEKETEKTEEGNASVSPTKISDDEKRATGGRLESKR
jgi:hypothetical protein